MYLGVSGYDAHADSHEEHHVDIVVDEVVHEVIDASITPTLVEDQLDIRNRFGSGRLLAVGSAKADG